MERKWTLHPISHAAQNEWTKNITFPCKKLTWESNLIPTANLSNLPYYCKSDTYLLNIGHVHFLYIFVPSFVNNNKNTFQWPSSDTRCIISLECPTWFVYKLSLPLSFNNDTKTTSLCPKQRSSVAKSHGIVSNSKSFSFFIVVNEVLMEHTYCIAAVKLHLYCCRLAKYMFSL